MGKQASAGDGNKAIEKPNLWLIRLWSPFSPTAYANSLAPSLPFKMKHLLALNIKLPVAKVL